MKHPQLLSCITPSSQDLPSNSLWLRTLLLLTAVPMNSFVFPGQLLCAAIPKVNATVLYFA